jgi:hypothetical protein
LAIYQLAFPLKNDFLLNPAPGEDDRREAGPLDI